MLERSDVETRLNLRGSTDIYKVAHVFLTLTVLAELDTNYGSTRITVVTLMYIVECQSFLSKLVSTRSYYCIFKMCWCH